jgi:signal peptidase II
VTATIATGKAKFLLLSLAVFALDQWSKWLVEAHVPLHGARQVIPGLFEISHVRNTGVAFGLLPASGSRLATWLLVLLGGSALGLLGWFLAHAPAHRRLLLVGLAAALGGATGNLLDRVVSGAVTDFLGFYHGSWRWYDFNIGDSAIVVGLGLILLDAFLTPAPEEAAPASS